MRRLTEILDVPKAWYKRGLMQRIFLGKEGAYATQTSMNQSTKTTSVPSSPVKPSTILEPLDIPRVTPSALDLATTPRSARITVKKTPG